MTHQRAKSLFFIFLLLSAHAYRLDAHRIDAMHGSQNKIQTGMNSTGTALAAHKLLQGPQYAWSAGYRGYTTLTHSSYYSQSITRLSVTSNGAGGYYTRSTVTSMSELCTPGLYNGMKMDVVDAGLSAGMSPYWPLLIAAGVVMMGGLYLYHRHRMNAPAEAQFCPVTSWQADPAGLLVPPAAFDTFGGEFTALLSEETNNNNRGMPKCHGLRRHRLRADCDGDIDCKRQACRQMCCDRRDCTFYQFNNIDSTDYCWLGSRSRLSTETCEQPYYGETCTTCLARRVELWPQFGEDNMKCHSAMFGQTGFVVQDQYECQAHAIEQGHEYYQFDSSRNMCESEATCASPSSHSSHSWRIFSNRPAPTPAAARPSPDQEEWQFAPFLFHEHREMTTVELTSSEQCSAGDVTCMRDACRAKCLEHEWCINYQFEGGGDACHLGATHVVDEDDVGMWFGGILTQNRLCSADEFKCPSNHECTTTCGGECPGHSREGPDGWCVRTAVENIVDEPNWASTYNEHPINAWCRGIERAVVTVSQGMAAGQSGADICRAACSADSSCAVWQMYPSDAANTDLSEGDHVRCWLGFEDQLGRPRFSCTGRSPKRWRLLTAPVGEAVGVRGCQEGKVACVVAQTCVDFCQDACPGFSITDAEAGICQPPANPDCMTDGVPMDMAIANSLPGLEPNPEFSMIADEGDLFTMSLNLNNMINPDTFEGDTTSVCDVLQGAECDLRDGACVCEYDEDTDCMTLFAHPERIAPIMTDQGMMMLSQQGCSCDGRTCTLQLLNSVPPVRTNEESTAAVQLAVDEEALCVEGTTCPNMQACEVIQYGIYGCGYSCEGPPGPNGEEGKYWCSDRCACNLEEAVRECVAGTMCPEMDSCDPISYGEYGCGYGCMKAGVFHFCNDACTVCNT